MALWVCNPNAGATWQNCDPEHGWREVSEGTSLWSLRRLASYLHFRCLFLIASLPFFQCPKWVVEVLVQVCRFRYWLPRISNWCLHATSITRRIIKKWHYHSGHVLSTVRNTIHYNLCISCWWKSDIEISQISYKNERNVSVKPEKFCICVVKIDCWFTCNKWSANYNGDIWSSLALMIMNSLMKAEGSRGIVN